MDVYLVDGTYELFRHYHALPSAREPDGQEVAAVRGVILSILGMIERGVTHVGVATDHVIESFRNHFWPGYKTGTGIAPDLISQFQLLENALSAMGIAVWPMVEFEADDALASAAAKAARDSRVDRVIICNDSVVGPMRPFDEILDPRRAPEDADFWGMTGSNEISPHVQSWGPT